MSAVFPSAIPADSLHGDECQGCYSVEEEAFIDHRADELLAARLADRDRFYDLLSGIDHKAEIWPHLFRALANLDAAIRGEAIGEVAVTIALSEIQRRLRVEAGIVWIDECREEAEQQLKREFA